MIVFVYEGQYLFSLASRFSRRSYIRFFCSMLIFLAFCAHIVYSADRSTPSDDERMMQTDEKEKDK